MRQEMRGMRNLSANEMRVGYSRRNTIKFLLIPVCAVSLLSFVTFRRTPLRFPNLEAQSIIVKAFHRSDLGNLFPTFHSQSGKDQPQFRSLATGEMEDGSFSATHLASQVRLCQVANFTSSDGYMYRMGYECAGPAYEAFGQIMSAFANNRTLHGETWGRRWACPLPPNTTIVVLGNSHTRQMIESFLCRHKAHLSWIVYPGWLVFLVHFRNNATMIVVTNTPVFERSWREARIRY